MLRCLRLGAAIAAAAAAGSAEAAPQGRPSRRLQNNAEERDERAILLAFKASGNGLGLESWTADSEPCGAGWNSFDEGWLGVVCWGELGCDDCAGQPGGYCSIANGCPTGTFCNFDNGDDSGVCEACSDCNGPEGCDSCGLPSAGADDCTDACSSSNQDDQGSDDDCWDCVPGPTIVGGVSMLYDT